MFSKDQVEIESAGGLKLQNSSDFSIPGSLVFFAGTTPPDTTFNEVQIAAPASADGYTMRLPSSQGAGALTNDGSGNLSWASADENAIMALTGPVTATGPGSAAATITPTGVTPGSYIGADITVNAAGQVTAAANGFTSGSNGNGYWVKDPTGRIHQWGSVSGTISTGSIIPFATPFSNASSVSVVASAIITHGSGIGYPSITNGSVTTTQFGVEMGSNPSEGIYWQADGN